MSICSMQNKMTELLMMWFFRLPRPKFKLRFRLKVSQFVRPTPSLHQSTGSQLYAVKLPATTSKILGLAIKMHLIEILENSEITIKYKLHPCYRDAILIKFKCIFVDLNVLVTKFKTGFDFSLTSLWLKTSFCFCFFVLIRNLIFDEFFV